MINLRTINKHQEAIAELKRLQKKYLYNKGKAEGYESIGDLKGAQDSRNKMASIAEEIWAAEEYYHILINKIKQ